MRHQRINELEGTLDDLYKHWRDTRKETIGHLGDKEALKIIDFHANNWIDIVGWISADYPRDEQMNIVYIQWLRLFKEIYWLQFLFYSANYPAAYRNLRYMWEMLSQAYYVDAKYPGASLDEQFDWARVLEGQHIYGWRVVETTLRQVLNKPTNKVVALFKPLWNTLNRYVHPSTIQMDMVAEEDFSVLVTDSFNEKLAKGLQDATDQIMDVIYATVLNRFPKAKTRARNYKHIHEWEDCLPNTMAIIRRE